jgi:ribonuclease D
LIYSIIKIVITFEQWNNCKKPELLELMKKLNLENETNKQIKKMVQGKYRGFRARNEEKKLQVIKKYNKQITKLEEQYRKRKKQVKKCEEIIQAHENDISNLIAEKQEVEEKNESEIVNVSYNAERGYIGINDTKYLVRKLIANSNVAAKNINSVITSVFIWCSMTDMDEENLYNETTYMRWMNSFGEKLLNFQCL